VNLITSLLIHHARILLPNGEWLVGDVLVWNKRIVEVTDRIDVNDIDKSIDATGLTSLPGVIEVLWKGL
jgi:dihydroorotase